MGRIGRIAVPPPAVAASTPVDGYRMRARLHFKDGRAGFFREATHDVCDARETRQLRPETSDVLERIAARLVSLERSPVRDIEVSENVSGAERAVYLDASEPLDPAAFVGLADSEGITGLAVRGTGREASLVSGTAYVTDVLSAHGESVTLRRHVQSFFQANRHLLGRFLDHVVSLVPPGASVVDLYAGVGLFAVALAGRASSVVAVEGDRLSAQDLAHNAGMAIGSVEVVRLPVEAFLERVPTTPDILIVDPPRTGMSRDAIRGAVALRAPTVVYVSCDVATLARDTRTLVDAGYALGDLQAFDMFPNTPHVETVAVFSRRA
jgi:tRNA/tmRNA/rRNA uracil-C5-methylase (TrmA/RlmC/RlmD family)